MSLFFEKLNHLEKFSPGKISPQRGISFERHGARNCLLEHTKENRFGILYTRRNCS
jgi:hypothetical protein